MYTGDKMDATSWRTSREVDPQQQEAVVSGSVMAESAPAAGHIAVEEGRRMISGFYWQRERDQKKNSAPKSRSRTYQEAAAILMTIPAGRVQSILPARPAAIQPGSGGCRRWLYRNCTVD